MKTKEEEKFHKTVYNTIEGVVKLKNLLKFSDSRLGLESVTLDCEIFDDLESVGAMEATEGMFSISDVNVIRGKE